MTADTQATQILFSEMIRLLPDWKTPYSPSRGESEYCVLAEWSYELSVVLIIFWGVKEITLSWTKYLLEKSQYEYSKDFVLYKLK